MQRESEKKVEKYLVIRIKSLGGLCIKLVAQHFTGLPDRLCLLPGGILFFVETKSEGDKPRPRQLFVHNQLRLLGFKVYVCDTRESVNNILNAN